MRRIAPVELGAFAGIHYWHPKITGRMLRDSLGKATFWLMFAGAWGTIIPMYLLGLLRAAGVGRQPPGAPRPPSLTRGVHTFAPSANLDEVTALQTSLLDLPGAEGPRPLAGHT